MHHVASVAIVWRASRWVHFLCAVPWRTASVHATAYMPNSRRALASVMSETCCAVSPICMAMHSAMSGI